MTGKPALLTERVSDVSNPDVVGVREQWPEKDAGESGDGAVGSHTTQNITPDTLGTIPHPLLFLISGRPWDGVSGAVVDTAANSVAVTGTSLSTSGVFGFAQSAVSAAFQPGRSAPGGPGPHHDRHLSSKRSRRKGAAQAPLPVP